MSETAAAEKIDEYLRRFTRELPVVLNEHENQLYGKMLAEKCKEQELAIEKKKQVMADHANRIKVITNEIKRLADARAKGEELRPVMCGERLHGNVIEIVRIDRGEVVDTRPADLKDLQTNLPGMGMPQIPEGFDEGPRGAGLGSTADKPVNDEAPGEMVTSSMGDQVYVDGNPDQIDGNAPGDDEDDGSDTRVCDACGEVVSDEDETAEYEGSTIHKDCVPNDAQPDNVVKGDFGGATPQEGESEDEALDRYLEEREQEKAAMAATKPESSPMSQRDRDIAQREKEIAEEKSKSKPQRSRSAKANAGKGKKKK